MLTKASLLRRKGGAPRPRRSAISGAHNHNVNRGERGGVVVGVTSWPNAVRKPAITMIKVTARAAWAAA